MEGRILKRTLTERSTLGFGEFAGVSIRSIINVKYTYIGWIYYNYEIIDFNDDIKRELRLIEIPKPGIAPKVYADWIRKYGEKLTDEEKMHGVAKKRAGAARAAKVRLAAAEYAGSLSKRVLQGINQGRIKPPRR